MATLKKAMDKNGSNLNLQFLRAADSLRGSAINRTDWKGSILPLLFFKRISDVWGEEHEQMLEECL